MNNIQKKRGRPAKNINKNKEPILETIKNNETEFVKYSLINNNIIKYNNNNKNVIIHLKISKIKLIELENIILNKSTNSLYNSFDKTIKNSNNESIINTNITYENEIISPPSPLPLPTLSSNSNIDSKDSINNKLKFNNKKLINLNNNDKTPINPINPIKIDIIENKNLLINSGIKYTIHSNEINYNIPNNNEFLCWHDCHTFSGIPIGIPEKITFINNEFIFELSGYFCSYNCAMAYICPNTIDDKYNINTFSDLSYLDEQSEKIQLLEMLCHLELKLPLNVKIKNAPPKLALKSFKCGNMTIEEFRQNFYTNTIYHIYKYPIISINYNLEETIKMKKNNNNNNDNVPNNYFNKLLNISKKNTF